MGTVSRIDSLSQKNSQEIVETWIPGPGKEKNAETSRRKKGWKRDCGEAKATL